MNQPKLIIDYDTQLVTVENSNPTVSVIWDRQAQQAVINDKSGPTIASRTYGMIHTAIYDAWSAYADIPISTNLGDRLQRPESENTEENKMEAMSYAAYYVLLDLFPEQKAMFDRQMLDLGYDVASINTDSSEPASIGYLSAKALLDVRKYDGSNQLGNAGDGTPYSDYTDYQASNEPENIEFIELWTPDLVSTGDGQYTAQKFLTPQWVNVTPFALDSASQFRPVAPQPFLLVDGRVDLKNQTITLSDGTVLDITPELVGTVINPEFIAQAEEVVAYSANLTDEQKLTAEFWEDGTGTSYPPGTFMTFGRYVSARDNNSLDEDAQMFFALGNAVFDAGIAVWEAKIFYDYARPVSVVRELGELGLIGEYNADLGGYAIAAYGGNGEGTQTILATDFITYQTPNSDLSPPFAEYVSGHSTFSNAGAEVLTLFTGSDDFGGSLTFTPGTSRFEPGITPVEDTTLYWDTFSDAADEAGISRLYGGIHFNEGNLNGRKLGREVGNTVYEKTLFYINGGDSSEQVEIFFGTDGADVLFGKKEADLIDELAGDDFIDGNQGNDTLFGETGNDFLDGGKDNDLIDGGEGFDILLGGKGNDTLFGSLGNDYLYGGKGDDLIDGGRDVDKLIGGKGNDLFVLRMEDGEDFIFDYRDGKDKFLLVDGLTYDDLEFNYIRAGTQILMAQNSETLAVIVGKQINLFDESDFVVSEAE